ncbi:MAG TPA: DUF2279 domain-containing protein, partial [Flavisolibacter sp.]
EQRSKMVWAGHGLAYGTALTGLYLSWYKGHSFGRFSFTNDNHKWMQVDKAGHAWSGYIQGKIAIEAWRWSGQSNKKAILKGGLTGFAFQNLVEILDGFSSNWGFSWGDYVADIAGTSMVMGQELAWNEQRIAFKFSTHKKIYPETILQERAEEIYGKSLAGQLLNDYNAQTYWLSVNLGSFFKRPAFPSWFNLAIGYGSDGLFGEYNNIWVHQDGTVYDRSDIKRTRQLYLSPDIDFTRIKTKSRWLKTGLFILNSFKMPAPTLEFSKNKTKWHWIMF